MTLKDWITPARTALLLIDMQVDFASPGGPMDKPGHDLTAAQAAVKQAERLAYAARAANVPLVFVRLITRPEDETQFLREWKERRRSDDPPLCREGTRGADFVGPQPASGDYVVSKSRYSPFDGTRLDESLRAMGRDTLVVCGLTTECCIDAAVQDAFARDYHVFIAADAVAAYEASLHQAALKALSLSCAKLAETAEIVAAWNKWY
jgi:ureidoacrylate peracid hydrolase